MTLTTLASQAAKFAADRSPLILTAVGVAGVVSTAVLTGRASVKAARVIDADYQNNSKDAHYHLDAKEKVELTWKLYIPPVAVGATTIAAIILANRIGDRRAAAMAAAFALSEKAFDEYKEKIVEKIGVAREQNARDSLAQDQVDKTPVSKSSIIITGGGNVLCFEPYTGRYFQSDMESLKKAQNDLNYQVLNNYYASLSDLYDLLDLEHTTVSDEMGWNSDEMLEMEISTCLADNGLPCLSMAYKVVPIRGYSRLN